MSWKNKNLLPLNLMDVKINLKKYCKGEMLISYCLCFLHHSFSVLSYYVAFCFVLKGQLTQERYT